jgi:hypothetical protein
MTSRNHNQARLSLEMLEDRLAPSGAPFTTPPDPHPPTLTFSPPACEHGAPHSHQGIDTATQHGAPVFCPTDE